MYRTENVTDLYKLGLLYDRVIDHKKDMIPNDEKKTCQ